MAQPKQLYRDSSNRMISGICAGLAEYFNLDVTLIRLIAVSLLIFSGLTVGIVYLVGIAVIPEKQSGSPLGKE